MSKAQNLNIFLPSGDPQGIRMAHSTSRVAELIEVPRKLLKDFAGMTESSRVATYVLVNEVDGEEVPVVYIGETGGSTSRFKTHDGDVTKEFWTHALVLTSKTESLTKTHALYLEWKFIQEGKKHGR